MSLIATPTQLEKGLKGIFFSEAASVPPSLVDNVATLVTSQADSEKYAWIGESPQMEEIIDEVKFVSLSDTGYTITNKEYAAGIAVRSRDVKNDQTGGIAARTRQLASVAQRHVNKLLINALINGTTNLGYDGVAMFSDTHTARDQQASTQDNLLAGSGTSTANVQTDINAGIAAILNFLAENNEPYTEEINRIAIIAPPALRKPIIEAVQAGIISQTDNVQVDGISWYLHFSGRLTSTDVNDWYMLDVGGPVRPLVYQLREGVRFEALEDGDTAFVRNEYRYKAQAYHEVGYGPWQKAVKFVNT